MVSVVPSAEVDRVNFKRLLRACEALAVEKDDTDARARLAAYQPALRRLFDAYAHSGAHKRTKVRDYERRIDEIFAQKQQSRQSAATSVAVASSSSAAAAEEEENEDDAAEELAQMAAALKEANVAIRRTIREDTRVVDELDGAVQSNLQRLRTQGGRLRAVNPGAFRRIVRLTALLVAALLVFFLVYTFIRWVPKRAYPLPSPKQQFCQETN